MACDSFLRYSKFKLNEFIKKKSSFLSIRKILFIFLNELGSNKSSSPIAQTNSDFAIEITLRKFLQTPLLEENL